MPTLEIKQKLSYQSTVLEKMIERELGKYGLCFPQPILLGQNLEDIQDGIIRELKRNNRFLFYHKFFKGENEFLKASNSDYTSNFYIDEIKLLDILNSNRIYAEELRMTEGPTGIALIYYPLRKEHKIDFIGEKGIMLFTRIIYGLHNSVIDQHRLQNGIHYYIDYHGSSELGIKMVSDMIIPHFVKIEDYLEMFIKYFVK